MKNVTDGGSGRARLAPRGLVPDPVAGDRHVVLRAGGTAIAYATISTPSHERALERYLWRVPAGYAVAIESGPPAKDLGDALALDPEDLVAAIKAGAYGRPERALYRRTTDARSLV